MTTSLGKKLMDFFNLSAYSREKAAWQAAGLELSRDTYDRDPAAFTFRNSDELKKLKEQTDNTLSAFNRYSIVCRTAAEYQLAHDEAMKQSELRTLLQKDLRVKMQQARQKVAA